MGVGCRGDRFCVKQAGGLDGGYTAGVGWMGTVVVLVVNGGQQVGCSSPAASPFEGLWWRGVGGFGRSNGLPPCGVMDSVAWSLPLHLSPAWQSGK